MRDDRDCFDASATSPGHGDRNRPAPNWLIHTVLVLLAGFGIVCLLVSAHSAGVI